MPLNIRDPRAQELARELADQEGITMTQAVIRALENEVNKARRKVPLATRAQVIAKALAKRAPGGGRRMTKKQIDAMWGQ